MAFYPGETDWSNFDGDYTLSSDGQTLILPTTLTTPIRSYWHDSASGISLVNIDGTATGTLLGRSSNTRPDIRGDGSLIQPADTEWLHYYDASSGLRPDQAGWTKSGTITSNTPSDGFYRMQSSGVSYYYKVATLSLAAAVTVFRLGVRPNTGHSGAFEIWLHFNSTSYVIKIQGSAFGANAQKIWSNADLVDGLTWNYDTTMDLVFVIRNSIATLNYRVRGSNTRYDLVDFTAIATPMSAGGGSSLILIGDVNTGIGVDCSIDHIGVWQGDEWSTIADGQTVFPINRRYWQFKSGTLSNGTLTELDIASSLSAPGNVSTSSSEVFGTNAISIINDSVSGANGYDYRLIRTSDSVEIQRKYDYDNGVVFTDVADGTYEVEVRAFTDDGIRSASALSVTGLVVPEPAIPNPVIALTVDDNLIAGGETSSLTYAVESGIDFYLNGSLTSGSGSIVAVTGQVVDTVIDLSVSDATIAPGETSALTWATSGAVVVNLNNSLVADSGTQTIATGIAGPTPTVVMSVAPSDLDAGEDAVLTYSISGTVTTTLNGGTITGSGTSVVATANTSAVVPPNAPTSINVINEPNRPTYIGVL